MNEPIFKSVHHLHRPYTIAIRQQWLTPGVTNCMVFNPEYSILTGQLIKNIIQLISCVILFDLHVV